MTELERFVRECFEETEQNLQVKFHAIASTLGAITTVLIRNGLTTPEEIESLIVQSSAALDQGLEQMKQMRAREKGDEGLHADR